jgi:hypothetical protein
MSRTALHRTAQAAAVGAVLTSAIAMTDALVVGLTDHESALTLGPGWVERAAVGVHGVVFALLAGVLVGFAAAIDAGSPVRRWTRRVLVALLVLMSVPQLAGFVVPIQDVPEPVLVAVSVAFVAGFPVAAALGLMLLRRPGLRAPAVVLSAVLPVLVLLIAVGFLAPEWAHPAYLEVPQYLGIALLGLRLATAPPAPGRAAGVRPAATSVTA